MDLFAESETSFTLNLKLDSANRIPLSFKHLVLELGS